MFWRSQMLTCFLVLSVLMGMASCQFHWTNTQTSLKSPDQFDLWTMKPEGCSCPHDILNNTCACCVKEGGCHCQGNNVNKCGQCGLESYCDNMCNITISSREIEYRSGQAYGQIKSPTDLAGPLTCWYRFEAEPGQRVEIQIYRIKRVGHIVDNKWCSNGFLQLIPYDIKSHDNNESILQTPDSRQISICGQNERFSPPLILFLDLTQEHNTNLQLPASSSSRVATLLFRVDETTSRSQFLAHYSFTPEDKENTGVHLKGGMSLNDSANSPTEDCDWLFEASGCSSKNQHEDKDEKVPKTVFCQLASPGFPGLYPPNRVCRFLIRTGVEEVLKLTFTHFNLPPNQCDTHYVSVYRGTSNQDPLYQKLCGFKHKQSFIFKGEKNILVEFRSGPVWLPITHNGFVAKLSFDPENELGGEDDEVPLEQQDTDTEVQDEKDEYDDEYDDYDSEDEGEVEDYLEEEKLEKGDEYAEKQDEEKKKFGRRKTKKTLGHKSSSKKCIMEIWGNETRSGLINSKSLDMFKMRQCSIVFKGSPGDVLLFQFQSYNLKGNKHCESFIRISIPKQLTRHTDSSGLQQICSPASLKWNKKKMRNTRGRNNNNNKSYLSHKQQWNNFGERGLQEQDWTNQGFSDFQNTRKGKQVNNEDFRGPLLVNYSTIVLDFKVSQRYEGKFKAVYKFHHVLSEGFPAPDSICDHIFSGRTGPRNGEILGSFDTLKSNLFWLNALESEGKLQCTTGLVPTDSQSVNVVIKSAPSFSNKDSSECETQCDSRGCACYLRSRSRNNNNYNDGRQKTDMEGIDHLLLTGSAETGKGQIGCFCGDFSHLLPVTIISSSAVLLVSTMNRGNSGFGFSATYNFQNEETCGPRRISAPIGSLESPLSLSHSVAFYHSSTYFHQNCQWFFDPPQSKQLVLEISTLQKGVDCLTWNATISIWDSSRYNSVGSTIDRFCPEILSKEYVLDTSNRKIMISLRSLSPIPIHYRITWETRGLLSRGGVMSAGSKVAMSTGHNITWSQFTTFLLLVFVLLASSIK